MKPVTTGMKVKVHHHKISLYGEVMGTNAEGKLLLANRPDFCTLKLCDFALFRNYSEVEFLQPETNRPTYFFLKPEPVVVPLPAQPEKKKLKPSALRKRILNNLLHIHEKQLVERSATMDYVECDKRIKTLSGLQHKIQSICARS